MLLLFSCRQETEVLPVTANSQTIAVSIPFHATGISAMCEPMTRSIDGLTITDGLMAPIKNVWVLQFNGTGPTANYIVGSAQYKEGIDITAQPDAVNPGSISVQLVENAQTQTIVCVANVPEGGSYMGFNVLGNASTLKDVVSITKTVVDETSLHHQLGSPAVETLMMSGIVETATNAATLITPPTVVFNRDVAKVQLQLTVDNADIEVVSVQLREVPAKMAVVDAVVESVVTGNYPVLPTTIDYAPEAVSITKASTAAEAAKVTWYMPRNRRGTVANSDATLKNTLAPAGSTYFEIVAKDVNTQATGVFRVYPGANQTNDFNIKGNGFYTIALTVKGLGSSTDSRVESYGDVTKYADDITSNSYILNPPLTGKSRTYTFNIGKSNSYWSSGDIGYGNDLANVLQEGETWSLELIWDDGVDGAKNNTPIFDESGTLAKPSTTGVFFGKATDTYAAGTSSTAQYTLVVPPGVPSGNFLIGLYNEDKTLLYSWHFWVTDYNPYQYSGTPTNGVYTYPVPGGQLERLTPAGNLMMDRHLGSITRWPAATPTTNGVYGDYRGYLTYQFGRKDPFPMNFGDKNGGGKFIFGAVPVNMSVAIQNPLTIYVNPSYTEIDWAADINNKDVLWHDVNAPASGNGKSFFDPCPLGWKVPEIGTWNTFGSATTSTNTSFCITRPDLDWFNGGAVGGQGLRFWPGNATAPVEGIIYYSVHPTLNTMGVRVTNVNTLIIWSSTPSSTKMGSRFIAYNGFMNTNGIGSMCEAFSIRCIQDK
jgi:hypothetical protein